MIRLVILLCCLGAAACSKTSPPQPPVVTPPGGTETINGTERIGWEQRAGDAVELALISYVLYVDGIRTALTGATCATTASATGFACSVRLPAMTAGSHALQLASFVNDGGVLESDRSATLTVTVVPGGAIVDQDPGTRGAGGVTDSPGARAVAPARMTTALGAALRAERVADGLDDPIDLAFTPDGRLLVAERGGRVRVAVRQEAPAAPVSDLRLLPEPALSLADTAGAGAALLALAVDPEFDRTRFVFAIYASPSRGGALAFSLARFREAANTLADAIVLLGGIPASASPAAALRFGADGKLYAAFDDGGDPGAGADRASLNAKTLRLNIDGTTPADSPRLTPVYADGHRTPRGFDWDARTGRPSAAMAASAAPYRGRLIPGFAGTVIVASNDGRLVVRSPAGPAETLFPERVAGVRVVAVSPEGAIYFATANAIARIVPDTP